MGYGRKILISTHHAMDRLFLEKNFAHDPFCDRFKKEFWSADRPFKSLLELNQRCASLDIFKKLINNKCCGYHAAALVEPITKAAACLYKALG